MGNMADFLKNYDSRSTQNGYSAALYTFIDCIYGEQRKGGKVTPDERIVYEKLVDKYLIDKRDYAADLMKFATSLQSRPPLSARLTFSYVKEFLASNDIEAKHQDLKRIRNKLPKGGSRTIERDLDIETVRSIIQHMDVKGRALVLVLASSGMRINEVLSLPIEDIDLKSKPAVVQIRGANSKTGDNRITFISSEAVQAVQEWLKVRDAYLKSSQYRNNGFVAAGKANPKHIDDNRLFPFTSQTASQIWDGALKKSGFFSQDTTTNRKQLHYHMFRKFFISQLSLIVSKEIPEMLAGHEGYLTGAYRRYPKKQLAEQYLKGEHVLTIQTPKELIEIESEFKAEMAAQSKRVLYVIDENSQLKEQMKELTAKFETLDAIGKFITADPTRLQRLAALLEQEQKPKN